MMKWFVMLMLAAVTVQAEPRQDVFTIVGRSNATSAVLSSLEGTVAGRGILQRIIITVSGTTTTWFTNSAQPFIGYSISGFAASNDTITNTIKILYLRTQ